MPILIDEVSSTETYIGTANQGIEETASDWQIMKMTVVGTVTDFKVPAGVKPKHGVWADRTTYTYE
jgi:hypothetical protein